LTSTDPAVLAAKQTSINLMICPSNPNRRYNETNTGWREYFMNYKAIGATKAESLRQCLDPDEPPPYGNKRMHPNGILYPGKGSCGSDSAIDVSSRSIMIVETMDDLHSIWLAGADATLVGMPNAPMENVNGSWIPKGFNKQFGKNASPEIQSLRTFLSYDFRPGGKDAGSYPASVGRTPRYGPSSAHPGVVNHLFADGTVRSLNIDIDYALYFFLIRRESKYVKESDLP
jgi:hypothetical protein